MTKTKNENNGKNPTTSTLKNTQVSNSPKNNKTENINFFPEKHDEQKKAVNQARIRQQTHKEERQDQLSHS